MLDINYKNSKHVTTKTAEIENLQIEEYVTIIWTGKCKASNNNGKRRYILPEELESRLGQGYNANEQIKIIYNYAENV